MKSPCRPQGRFALLLALGLGLSPLGAGQEETLIMEFSGATANPSLIAGFPLNTNQAVTGTFVYNTNSPGTELEEGIKIYPQERAGGFTLRIANLEFRGSSYFVGVADQDPTETFVVRGDLLQVIEGDATPAKLEVEINVVVLDQELLAGTELLELFPLLQFLETANFSGVRLEQLELPEPLGFVSGSLDEFAPQVTGKPSVFVRPSRVLEVGEVPVGSSSRVQIVTENFGDEDLLLTQDAETSSYALKPDLVDDFVLVGEGSTLPLEVTFMPPGEGLFEETLVLITNDPETPRVEVLLRGTGTPLNDSIDKAPTIDLSVHNPSTLAGTTRGTSPFRNYPTGAWYRVPTLTLQEAELTAVVTSAAPYRLRVVRDDLDEVGQFLDVITDEMAAPADGDGVGFAVRWESRRNRTYYVLAHPLTEGAHADFLLTLAQGPLELGGGQVPGDCNQDGTLDIGDPVCLFRFLFVGDPARLPCGDGSNTDPSNVRILDCNNDATTDLGDGVCLLNFLFQGSAPPALGRECVPVAACPEACAP
jgi:hypothetical protein